MRKYVYLFILTLLPLAARGQHFEKPQLDTVAFEKMKVKVGADFALQLQGLSHEAPNSATPLTDLKKNFNLPTANFSLTADLAPGVQIYLNTFLSSRHHNEAWVEGGYLLIDRLPFLPAADKIMESFTIKAGVMSPNYGDAQYYRSNNAAVFSNPFVGNWIMDAYTTNPGLEIMFRNNGIIAMVGANNGRLNYGRGGDLLEDIVVNWKLGYETEVIDDLNLRATVSGYHVPDGHNGSYLWGGDRAGARYYSVMDTIGGDNFRSGRWDPGSGQTQMGAYQGALFAEYKGLEFFGFYEKMSGIRKGSGQEFSQIGAQLKYQYKSLYAAARYNLVQDHADSEVNRINVGIGWYMLESVLMKLEFVNQNYSGPAHGHLDGGSFNGLVLEAAISF